MATGQPSPNLKARRESASLTPEELARRANVSLRAVIQAERDASLRGGPVNISVTELKRIADVLSTTVSDIRGY